MAVPYKCQEGLVATLNMLDGLEVNIMDYATGDYEQKRFQPWINITSWTLSKSLTLKSATEELNLLAGGSSWNKMFNFLWVDDGARKGSDANVMLVYVGMKVPTVGALLVEQVTPGIWKRIGTSSLNMKNKSQRKLPDNAQDLGAWLNAQRSEGLSDMWKFRTTRIV